MLDEVFCMLDEYNLNLAKEFLLRLRSQYQNIIIISHIEDLKDLPEYLILLEQINGVTQILS
jgi:DNA repair exonuclease SbcCD ATPase subunit